MQTTTRRTRNAHKPAVFPNLPSTDHPGFWLAAFLRDAAELDALKEQRRLYNKKKSYCEITGRAFSSADYELRKIASHSLSYAVRDGLLPFAHAHTTYFDQQVAA